MTLLLANIPATVCFITAGVLAYHGSEGWGWFLLVGLMVAHIVKSRKDDDDDDPPSIPTPPRSVINRN